jgi:pimeloyl-ACP methyl ester carboxylesterase
MKKIRILICFFFLIQVTSCDQRSEPFKASTYYSYQVSPPSTDEEIQSTISHSAFVDTRTTLKGKLLVFLGGTGTSPQNYSLISRTATQLGYHVINLSYPNTVDGQVCKDRADPKCFANYHEEVIFGGTQSDLVSVNKANSINNRILKLLQRLNNLNGNNGWNQFFDGSELVYSKFVLAGHSQGGGHAAYMAHKFPVDRVVLLSSPNDYSDVTNQPAAWCKNLFATSSERFFGLTHKRDEASSVSKQYAVWKGINMLKGADTVSADGSSFSGSNALVTDFNQNLNAKAPVFHNLTALDNALPLGDNLAHLKEVWAYLMGNSGR